MTGTPSRTATAPGGGATRHSDGPKRSLCAAPSPRGGVGRKLQAKLRPEEHEPHGGGRLGGRRRSVARSPMSSGPAVVDAAGRWSEGHAPYPGRSACLPWEQQCEQRFGRAVEFVQATGRRTPVRLERTSVPGTVGRRLGKPQGQRWAGRSQQTPIVTAAHGGERAEQEAPNRHEAFDA